jgi:hypothetical protein
VDRSNGLRGRALLCRPGKLYRQRHTNDDQRLLSISFHDQHVALLEPVVELAEASRAAFDLDRAINAKYRHT